MNIKTFSLAVLLSLLPGLAFAQAIASSNEQLQVLTFERSTLENALANTLEQQQKISQELEACKAKLPKEELQPEARREIGPHREKTK